MPCGRVKGVLYRAWRHTRCNLC